MNMQPLLHRVLVLSSCLALFACQKNVQEVSPELSAASKVSSEKINTFKGPEVQMGLGKARSFISVNHEGVPQEIGIELTSGALQGLPDVSENPHPEWVLPLHPKAEALTAFDHIAIDWNEFGHEPPGVFTIPHFDFHFYMMPLAERLAIPPYEVDPTGFDQLPPTGHMPDSYVRGPGGVPQMGTHWLNPMDLAKPFTAVMIYGSYGGKVTFEEPMITMQELTTNSMRNIDYPQPRIYEEVGVWYPTDYNYYKSGDKYYITLSDFVWSAGAQ